MPTDVPPERSNARSRAQSPSLFADGMPTVYRSPLYAPKAPLVISLRRLAVRSNSNVPSPSM